MLRKGCQGYLAYVYETGKEGTLVDEIPVVREFPNVFPDDIQDYLQIERWSSPLI